MQPWLPLNTTNPKGAELAAIARSKGKHRQARCLVYLPHSYTGRGPAHSCVRIVEHFPANGLPTELFVVRCRKAVSPALMLREALGPVGRWLPYRLLAGIGRRVLEWRFARAIDRAAPGSIAYFWPDSPAALVLRAKACGLVTVREMINSPLAYAKPALDRAYQAAELPPTHGLDTVDVERENAELVLYDFLFASNPEVEAAMVRAGVPADRILPVTFGRDEQRFSGPTSVPERQQDGLRACFVGTLNVRKGVADLLVAWQQAGIAGELWLAGSIEPCLARLVSLAVEGGTVRHFGHVEDVAQFYRQCDVFVFPTHEEGGPQVTYEAAGCGLPVITTPMGAARLVEHGKTGLVFPIGDREALADCLQTIASQPAMREEMGRAAQAASANFEYRAVSMRRAALLRQLPGAAFEPVSQGADRNL